MSGCAGAAVRIDRRRAHLRRRARSGHPGRGGPARPGGARRHSSRRSSPCSAQRIQVWVDGPQVTGPVWSAPEPLAGPPGDSAAGPLRAASGPVASDARGQPVSLRSGASDLRQRLRAGRGGAAGDPRPRSPPGRVLPGHHAGDAGGDQALRRVRRPPHPDRPDHLLFLVGLLLLGGSLRRLVLVVSAFTVAHSITLSLAVLSPYPAGMADRASHRAEHHLCRRRQPDGPRRARRACLDRLRLRPHSRLRLRQRAAGDGTAAARASAGRCCRSISASKPGSSWSSIPVASVLALIGARSERARAAAGSRRLGRRDRRRRLLVHPARLVLKLDIAMARSAIPSRLRCELRSAARGHAVAADTQRKRQTLPTSLCPVGPPHHDAG